MTDDVLRRLEEYADKVDHGQQIGGMELINILLTWRRGDVQAKGDGMIISCNQCNVNTAGQHEWNCPTIQAAPNDIRIRLASSTAPACCLGGIRDADGTHGPTNGRHATNCPVSPNKQEASTTPAGDETDGTIFIRHADDGVVDGAIWNKYRIMSLPDGQYAVRIDRAPLPESGGEAASWRRGEVQAQPDTSDQPLSAGARGAMPESASSPAPQHCACLTLFSGLKATPMAECAGIRPAVPTEALAKAVADFHFCHGAPCGPCDRMRAALAAYEAATDGR